MTPTARILRVILCLYPRRFRRRFGHEWIELAELRIHHSSDKGRGGVHGWLFVLRDAVRAIPVAYGSFFMDSARRLRSLVRRAFRWIPSIRLPNWSRAMSSLVQDVRYAFRSFRRAPLFVAVTLLTLGLGVGATTAIFSVVDTVLLRPLPYHEPQRLFQLGSTWPTGELGPVSPPIFFDWRERSRTFTRMAAVVGANLDLVGDGHPERFRAAGVSSELFDMLGVTPHIGRLLTRPDDHAGAERTVVLSHGTWQQRWGADSSIVGRRITLSGQPYTVVGVLPSGFTPPEAFRLAKTEMWFPLVFVEHDLASHNNHFLRVLGRLADGVSIEIATDEMHSIVETLSSEYPAGASDIDGFRFQVQSLHRQTVGDIKSTLVPLFGAVLFLLLIACANVINLFLARGIGRQREIAVRCALGAGRGRILRQLVTESLVLTVIGGLLGAMVAVVGVSGLRALAPGNIPRLTEVIVDLRVLWFALALSVGTGVLLGIVPMAQFNRRDKGIAFRQDARTASAGRTARAVRQALVIVEIALSLILLVGGGLLLNSFVRLRRVDPGFEARAVITVPLDLVNAYDDKESRATFYRSVLERLANDPDFEHVAVTTSLPFGSRGSAGSMVIEGRALDPNATDRYVRWQMVSADYFRSLGASILPAGRDFTADDESAQAQVAVVNEAFAREFSPERDAVGRRLQIISTGAEAPWRTVVGVVSDFKQGNLSASVAPEVYLPYTASRLLFEGVDVVVRTGQPVAVTAQRIRTAIWQVDPGQPVGVAIPLEQAIAASIVAPRFYTLLLGSFAVVALVLASVGVYGTMAFLVGQQRKEIGIRAALGASSSTVSRFVVGQGARLAAAGMFLGILGAMGLSRFLSDFLYGITPTDPVTFLATAAILGGVAISAAYIPARRAAQVDPIVVLRVDS